MSSDPKRSTVLPTIRSTCSGIGDVCQHRERPGAKPARLGSDGVDRRAVARAVDRHVRPGGGQRQGDRPADVLAGTGDERRSSGKRPGGRRRVGRSWVHDEHPVCLGYRRAVTPRRVASAGRPRGSGAARLKPASSSRQRRSSKHRPFLQPADDREWQGPQCGGQAPCRPGAAAGPSGRDQPQADARHHGGRQRAAPHLAVAVDGRHGRPAVQSPFQRRCDPARQPGKLRAAAGQQPERGQMLGPAAPAHHRAAGHTTARRSSSCRTAAHASADCATAAAPGPAARPRCRPGGRPAACRREKVTRSAPAPDHLPHRRLGRAVHNGLSRPSFRFRHRRRTGIPASRAIRDSSWSATALVKPSMR